MATARLDMTPFANVVFPLAVRAERLWCARRVFPWLPAGDRDRLHRRSGAVVMEFVLLSGEAMIP